jgi:acylphosphatase
MPVHHLIVKGKVQGVFFRASAKEKAEQLGIRGWVRNTEEGHVEIMASGEEQSMKAFLNWCHHGPEKAIVQKVEQLDSGQPDLPNSFKIIR